MAFSAFIVSTDEFAAKGRLVTPSETKFWAVRCIPNGLGRSVAITIAKNGPCVPPFLPDEELADRAYFCSAALAMSSCISAKA